MALLKRGEKRGECNILSKREKQKRLKRMEARNPPKDRGKVSRIRSARGRVHQGCKPISLHYCCANPLVHPTSFPLQFFINLLLDSQGDRIQALTRISPEID